MKAYLFLFFMLAVYSMSAADQEHCQRSRVASRTGRAMSDLVVLLLSLRDQCEDSTLLNASSYLFHKGYRLKGTVMLCEDVLREFCLEHIDVLLEVHRGFGSVKALKRNQDLRFDDIYYIKDGCIYQGNGKCLIYSNDKRKKILTKANRRPQREHGNGELVRYLNSVRLLYAHSQRHLMLLDVSRYLLIKGYRLQNADSISREALQEFCREHMDVLLCKHRSFLHARPLTSTFDMYCHRQYYTDSQGRLRCGNRGSSTIDSLSLRSVCARKISQNDVVSCQELMRRLIAKNSLSADAQELLRAVQILDGLGCQLKGPRHLTKVALQAFCREHTDVLSNYGFYKGAYFLYGEYDLTIVGADYIDEQGRLRVGGGNKYALDDYSRQESIDALIFKDMDRKSRLAVCASVNHGAAQLLLRCVCEIIEFDPKLAVGLPIFVLPYELYAFCVRYSLSKKDIPEEVNIVNGQYACLLRGYAAYGECNYRPESNDKYAKVEFLVRMDELCYAAQEVGIPVEIAYEENFAHIDTLSLFHVSMIYTTLRDKIDALGGLQYALQEVRGVGVVCNRTEILRAFVSHTTPEIQEKAQEMTSIVVMQKAMMSKVISKHMDVRARLQALAHINQGAAKELLVDVLDNMQQARRYLPKKVSVKDLQDCLKNKERL